MAEQRNPNSSRAPHGLPLRPMAAALPASLKALSASHLRLLAARTGEGDAGILYQHSVLCHTCLPYRNPGDMVRRWQAKNGFLALEVEAGRVFDPDRGFVDVGLPFGPKPRLVLAHLNAEALRTKSPVIRLDHSLTAFVHRTLGLDSHGRNIRAVREQLTRLAAADFRIGRCDSTTATTVHGRILNGVTLWRPQDPAERPLGPREVQFSGEYFESLTRHAVPLNEAAVSRLSHTAMGLDAYAWLAQRLHRIETGQSVLIAWSILAEQFGDGYAEVRCFKRVFMRTLRQVKAVYPDATFGLEADGMRLYPSRPPVARRLVAVSP